MVAGFCLSITNRRGEDKGYKIMRNLNRKATPRVVKGNVQKKNNWGLSEDYYYAPRRREVVIDRKRPRPGYRHLLTKKDLLDFIALLPDWDEIAVGLNAIVLAPG